MGINVYKKLLDVEPPEILRKETPGSLLILPEIFLNFGIVTILTNYLT